MAAPIVGEIECDIRQRGWLGPLRRQQSPKSFGQDRPRLEEATLGSRCLGRFQGRLPDWRVWERAAPDQQIRDR
jgi:hypothetical protein